MEQDENKEQKTIEKDIAMKVSAQSIVINTILSIFKLFAGIVASSGAMISDAVHSASDVFSTFIVIIGVNISNKKSDSEHQYGHERMECIASIILAAILLGTGLCIGYEGVKKIIYRNYIDIEIPGMLALVAAIVSIVVKEWMYQYTKKASKKINSTALMADAWHHRSDALSSVGALIGIFGSRIGFPVLDSVASVGICLFIVKASYDIFKDAANKLVDKSCDKKTVDKMKEVILNQDGVLHIDDIRTRIFGDKVYVDIEIAADGDKSLTETHKIAENVHHGIEDNFNNVKHCMVHVNPYKK